MFAGLTDADFDAYAPAKWKSNVWNRERLEVKQRLLELGRRLTPRLTDGGVPLELTASVEHPAQWNHKQVEAQHLFFSRTPEGRKELDKIIEKGKSIASMLDDPTPQRNHLFLALTVAHDRVEAALKLHPDARVDRQNLERRIVDHFEREKLLGLLTHLPAPFAFGMTGGPLVSASEATAARIDELVAGLAAPAPVLQLPGAPQRLLFVGRSWPRGDVTAAGDGFEAEAAAALSSLLPIYQYIAWSRDNDFVSMREALQKEKQVRRQRGLATRDEVRIVRGMFAGKLGVVQEIDARGGLKILVGKLAVKVDADDVEKR